MKTTKFFFCGLMTVAMLAVSAVVSAQEKSNKDAEGRTVRGPYETNSFGSNWFIGVAGGINTVATFKLPAGMTNKAGVGGAAYSREMGHPLRWSPSRIPGYRT